MGAGEDVNRKLVVVVAVAAVAALLAGAAVGRNLLSPATSPTQRPDVVRFKDEISKVSIAYPASWRRLEAQPDQPDIALIVQGDEFGSLIVRAAPAGIVNPTKQTLPIARKFTDGLVAEDPLAKQIVDPVEVELGGLLGIRYRYTFGKGAMRGAHDHYFLFKDGRLIQLVFQAIPVERLAGLTPVFQRIAGTFRGREK